MVTRLSSLIIGAIANRKQCCNGILKNQKRPSDWELYRKQYDNIIQVNQGAHPASNTAVPMISEWKLHRSRTG